jgi:prepilin-type N-terminal cleavage/methylation domain-containing protein
MRSRRARGFTLIELMVVMGIATIVMSIGVPIVYTGLRKEPFRQAVADIMEVCSNARARAILSGQMTEVVFHPIERRLEISGGGNAQARPLTSFQIFSTGKTQPDGLSAYIPEEVGLEMLDVNLSEYKESEMARVRFYPNGTCDEMTIVLRSDRGEFRKITTEVTTALVDVGDVR